jgi:hypothetical protein
MMTSASGPGSIRSIISPHGVRVIPLAMTAIPFRFAAEDPLRMHQH